MEETDAVAAFAALAQVTRLRLYRLLVAAGPLGMPAGSVALTLGVPAPTLSFHLKELRRAGLIRAVRQGRRVIYAADVAAMRALVDFLTEDCCQGHAELCRSDEGADGHDGAARHAEDLERPVPVHR